MNGTGWAVVIIILVILIGGGVWWYMQVPGAAVPNINIDRQEPATSTPDTQGGTGGTGTTTENGGGSSAPMTATVTYSSAGFSPSSVTIKKGGTVTWVNESGGNMWVASAQHPTHTVYAGTSRSEHCGSTAEAVSFDQCRAESRNFSFTFTKVGSWAYHDHINASRFGRVEVVE